MFVQIEEIIDAPKPPAPRGGTGMLLCLARCRAREGADTSVLILFSVPPHEAKNVAMTDLGVGRSVALWEPLVEVDIAYLCSRFVALE
jgi:hypothetical protein